MHLKKVKYNQIWVPINFKEKYMTLTGLRKEVLKSFLKTVSLKWVGQDGDRKTWGHFSSFKAWTGRQKDYLKEKEHSSHNFLETKSCFLSFEFLSNAFVFLQFNGQFDLNSKESKWPLKWKSTTATSFKEKTGLKDEMQGFIFLFSLTATLVDHSSHAFMAFLAVLLGQNPMQH